MELIEELQSTSVTPDEIRDLLPLRKIAPKKTKAKHVTQVCGSMQAKEMSKVQKISVYVRVKQNVQQLVQRCVRFAATSFTPHVGKQHAKLMGKGL